MNLKAFIFLLGFIPMATTCYFKPAPPDNEPGKFKPLNHRVFNRTISNYPCACGLDYSGNSLEPSTVLNQAWILYVHVRVNTSLTKVCVGTVINSNMVITSHRCLQKKSRFSVNDVMQMQYNMKGSDGHSSLAGTSDIILSTEAESTNVTFTVKKIIFSERFTYDSLYEQAPETDIVILVVEYDFTHQTETSVVSPICLAEYGVLATTDLLNREAHYQGTRHFDGRYYKTGASNFTNIRIAEECNKGGKLGVRPTSKDTLCLMFTQPGPTTEGGPVRINVKRLIEGGPRRSFLVGIGSWVQRTTMNAKHKYAYFSNINGMIKYIEQKADVHGSTWCPTLNPDDKQWPWEEFDETPKGTLDCKCGHEGDIDAIHGRIGGGQKADYYEFPWIVKFQIVKLFEQPNGTTGVRGSLCGGSVINDRMILTAAHCFVRRDIFAKEEGFNVHVFPGYPGIHQIYLHSLFLQASVDAANAIPYKVYAKEVLFHPGFVDELREGRVDYDIALIILTEPLKLGGSGFVDDHLPVNPVCLPKPGYLKRIVGQNATVAGWGVTDFRNVSTTSPILKKLNVPIRPLKECAAVDWQIGSYSQTPTDTKICASWFDPTENAGQGDSGGPLMHRRGNGTYTQVGIVSYLNNGLDKTNATQSILSTTYYANVEVLLPYIYYYSKKYEAQYCKE